MNERLTAEFQFERCGFDLKSCGRDGFCINPDFVSGILPILGKGWLSFEFQEGTTVPQAREVVRLLNEHVSGIAYHWFPEEG